MRDCCISLEIVMFLLLENGSSRAKGDRGRKVKKTALFPSLPDSF